MAPTMISTIRGTVSASTSTRNVSIPEIIVTSTSSTRTERITITRFTTKAVMVEKGVCAICLKEWSKGDLATELPCNHKYRLECVEKWLKIHSTCPQCRYVIPLKGKSRVDVDDDSSIEEDSSSDNDSSDSDPMFRKQYMPWLYLPLRLP